MKRFLVSNNTGGMEVGTKIKKNKFKESFEERKNEIRNERKNFLKLLIRNQRIEVKLRILILKINI